MNIRSLTGIALLILSACSEKAVSTSPGAQVEGVPRLRASSVTDTIEGRYTEAEVNYLMQSTPDASLGEIRTPSSSPAESSYASSNELLKGMAYKLWTRLDGWYADAWAVTYPTLGTSFYAYVELDITRTNPDPVFSPFIYDHFQKGNTGLNVTASVGTWYDDRDGIACLEKEIMFNASSKHEMRFTEDPLFPLLAFKDEPKRCGPGSGGGSHGGGGSYGGGGDYGGTGDGTVGNPPGTGTPGTGTTTPPTPPPDPCGPWGCDPQTQKPKTAPEGEPAPDDPCDIDPSKPGCPGSGEQFASRAPTLFFVSRTTDQNATRMRGVHVVFLDEWRAQDGVARIIRYPNGGRGRAAIYLPSNASLRGWLVALATLKRDEAMTGPVLTDQRDMIVSRDGTRTIRVAHGGWQWLPRWPLDPMVRTWNQSRARDQLIAITTARASTPRLQGRRRGGQKILAWEFDGLGSGREIRQSAPPASGT